MNSFFNIKRLIDTGSTIAGIGLKAGAKEFAGITYDEALYGAQLKNTLGKLKGPLVKVAQFLATVPDALPEAIAKELQELQASAPPMGITFVNRRLRGELGADWQKHFLNFNLKATNAASLGQVHQAQLIDGTKVAVKLQYPQMHETINADLMQLNFILNLYTKFNKAIDPEQLQLEIKERLLSELDYVQEAKNAQKFLEICKHDLPFVKVPTIYTNLSTNKLLTMEWLDGLNIFDYADQNQSSPNKINTLGANLFKAWYVPLYKYGILHCDPHPGNFKINDSLENQIGLLDFGCVRQFDDNFLGGVIDLYEAIKVNDLNLANEAYLRWGFTGDKELFAVLNEWAKLLYEPLVDDQVRPIQTENAGKKGFEIAKMVHKRLHALGGIKPPKEFVFMDRVAVTLGSILMRTKARANWHQLFESIIALRV